MLSVDIHIGRWYDDLIRKQELCTLGKSSKKDSRMQRVCRTTSTNHSFSESIKKQGVVSKSKSRSGIEALLREFRDRTYGRRETLTVGETAGLTPETLLSFISLKDGVFSMVFARKITISPDRSTIICPWREETIMGQRCSHPCICCWGARRMSKERDEDFVLTWYKKMIGLRLHSQWSELISEGTFTPAYREEKNLIAEEA